MGRFAKANVVLLFLYAFGNAAAYVVARTIADSAFLSHIGPDRLPDAFIISAVVVVVASLIYGLLLRRIRLYRLINITLILFAASSAAMPFAMARYPDSLSIFAICYLIAQVRGALGTIQLTTLINEQLDGEQAEENVGLVTAGATLAGIVMGIGVGLVSEYVNVEALMYATAVIDLLTVIPVLLMRKSADPATIQEPLTPDQFVSPDDTGNGYRMRDVLKSKYVMSIAAIVFLTVTAATFVEYQWKFSAAEEMHENEEGLARYFGYFYSVVYLITGVLQLFVTKRVLVHRGVIFGMLAFPAALLATTMISWLVSAHVLRLWPLTLSKGCDTLKRSLNDPSMKVLYGPMPQGMRRQAIAFVAGVCKPIAEASAALALLFIAHAISLRHLSLIVAGLLVVCLILIVRVWVWFAVGKEPVAAKASPAEGK